MGDRGTPMFRAGMTAALAVFLVGFGVCGVSGLIASYWVGPLVFACGLAGVGIACAAGRAIWLLWRKPPRPDA